MVMSHIKSSRIYFMHHGEMGDWVVSVSHQPVWLTAPLPMPCHWDAFMDATGTLWLSLSLSKTSLVLYKCASNEARHLCRKRGVARGGFACVFWRSRFRFHPQVQLKPSSESQTFSSRWTTDPSGRLDSGVLSLFHAVCSSRLIKALQVFVKSV